MGDCMKWWKKALIGSGVWCVLLVIGIVVMDRRIEREATSPAHREAWDKRASETAGLLFTIGHAAIWAVLWSRNRQKVQSSLK